jgi:hypothetical protein
VASLLGIETGPHSLTRTPGIAVPRPAAKGGGCPCSARATTPLHLARGPFSVLLELDVTRTPLAPGNCRRVYDALNVLMAMDIITKEKKNILWRGLPTNTEQEGARLQMDLNNRCERMERKRQHLADLVQQQISFKQLIARNRAAAGSSDTPVQPRENQIALPFIVVNTKKETVIDCEMAEDKQEIFFNFSAPFEIHDDSETLKRMNMQRCPPDRVDEFLPSELHEFAREMLQAPDAPPPAPGRGSSSRR